MRVRIPGVPYCRCRVLSGCVRAGEGCFRLCQLCLGNARIIMIIGRGGGKDLYDLEMQAAGSRNHLTPAEGRLSPHGRPWASGLITASQTSQSAC